MYGNIEIGFELKSCDEMYVSPQLSDCRKSLIFDVLLLYHSALTMITGYDSSVCRIALLGFAIQINTPVNMKEGDNQRDQVQV